MTVLHFTFAFSRVLQAFLPSSIVWMRLQEEEVIYSSPGAEGTACTALLAAPALCLLPVHSSLVWDALVNQ